MQSDHRYRIDFGIALLATGLLATAACAQRPSKTAMHPTAPVDIEAELARNEAALREAGITVPAAPAPAAPMAKTSPEQEIDEDQDQGEYEEIEQAMEDAAPASMSPPRAVESSETVSRPRGRGARATRNDESSRCDRVCDLSQTTCELAEHICGLAHQHPDENRYVEACARAERQCEAADQACQRCETT